MANSESLFPCINNLSLVLRIFINLYATFVMHEESGYYLLYGTFLVVHSTFSVTLYEVRGRFVLEIVNMHVFVKHHILFTFISRYDSKCNYAQILAIMTATHKKELVFIMSLYGLVKS